MPMGWAMPPDCWPGRAVDKIILPDEPDAVAGTLRRAGLGQAAHVQPKGHQVNRIGAQMQKRLWISL